MHQTLRIFTVVLCLLQGLAAGARENDATAGIIATLAERVENVNKLWAEATPDCANLRILSELAPAEAAAIGRDSAKLVGKAQKLGLRAERAMLDFATLAIALNARCRGYNEVHYHEFPFSTPTHKAPKSITDIRLRALWAISILEESVQAIRATKE